MREEAIIDGAEEGEGKKRRKWRARWRYRWRGGGTRQGNGNARRTEYRVGWSSEVARVRGKGFARETYKWHACLDTLFLYPSRSPALCKHCTIPFEPASIPKRALVKHEPWISSSVDDSSTRVTRNVYTQARENYSKDFQNDFSTEFPNSSVFFRSKKVLLLFSFASANVNIRSREEGMHDLSAVPV